ncbi:VanW family protein [Clostridium sp. AL.422]|uniref:VanW family protein n=1 Tax=Clostridium TaxID=1485 RepID=UPI00293DE3C9|nr:MULTISPECIES: VanW family protein [unclassified Clostridium]MDV4151558.1 VanW family protein [Clostridium sp. AL.422]
MSYVEKKPIKRSKLRLFVGKFYYKAKKYIYWFLSNKSYSRRRTSNKLEYLVFTHKTPLYRKLKDVDMYLQENKVENLKLALKELNGLEVNPGEYFSYWKALGKPSYRKGYKDGLVLCPDGSFKPGVGGGLCQLSNLIYWMTLNTPLTVTERYRHSHDVFPDEKRTQPFGSGATCYYNYLDLEIKNTTNSKYQLILFLTDTHLVGEWRSSEPCQYYYDIYEKEHSMTPGFFGNYIRNNVIYRKVYNLDSELINDEYICENHAFMMYQPYLSQSKQ